MPATNVGLKLGIRRLQRTLPAYTASNKQLVDENKNCSTNKLPLQVAPNRTNKNVKKVCLA